MSEAYGTLGPRALGVFSCDLVKEESTRENRRRMGEHKGLMEENGGGIMEVNGGECGRMRGRGSTIDFHICFELLEEKYCRKSQSIQPRDRDATLPPAVEGKGISVSPQPWE